MPVESNLTALSLVPKLDHFRESIMSRSRFQLGAVIAVLALGAFGPSRAFAFPIPRPHITPHMAEEAQLHAVKTLLEHADHDYNGHRAAAVRDLTAAIHELHPHHGKAHPKVAAHRASATRPHELQKLSDAQLREAIGKLEAVHHELAHGKAGHHKAAEHVAHAISELKTALSIK
jgi:hypothetical protein